MLLLSLVLIIVVCTVLSIRTKLLLIAALWLAITNAAVAGLLYLLGAREIAVIELSVGTGLVPVLFVFAASLMGSTSATPPSIVPKPLAYGLVFVIALIILSVLPQDEPAVQIADIPGSFGRVLWEDRGLEMLIQTVLVFAGVISILHLLAPSRRASFLQPRGNSQPDRSEIRREVV